MPGIYIHIPFCKQKCTYCDFASYPREIGKAEAYFACLYKEMKSRAAELKNMTFDTVYFGGGTPSYVEPKYILGCMRLIKKEFNLKPDAEITLEVNPGTLDRSKLRIYKEAGINRYSLGLQCGSDEILRSINRIHTVKDYVDATVMLKGYNFSTDIMIGLPDEPYDLVEKSILLAEKCGTKHVSLYALTPEEGTPMYSRYLNGDLPDADTVADYYDKARAYLKTLGFERYEVSNFAIPGYESKHNLNYWKRGEYIGLGVAASSFIAGRRFTNTESIDEYIHCLLSGKYAEVYSENIDGKDAKEEFVMLALRTERGVVLKEYHSAFGSDFLRDFESGIKSAEKYLDISDEYVRIKDDFLYVQNSVIIAVLGD